MLQTGRQGQSRSDGQEGPGVGRRCGGNSGDNEDDDDTDGDDLAVVRASKQYVVTESGEEYLDCLNGNALVGHTHPQVFSEGQAQVAKLTTAQGFVGGLLAQLVRRLVVTLPQELNVVYLCNDEEETNDLAIRLAAEYTGNWDVVAFEGARHGSMGVFGDLDPEVTPPVDAGGRPGRLHRIPLPQFGGANLAGKDPPPDEGTIGSSDSAVEALSAALGGLKSRGGGACAFICEPFQVTAAGVQIRREFMRDCYKVAREHGVVCVADETNTGLGRIGTHNWAFQALGVVPDIVTVGRSLGNGHPVGAVVCRREISSRAKGYFSTFSGNPVSCSIALAVLGVIKNEKLMSAAHNVGQVLSELLRNMQASHPALVARVEGKGLLWALDLADGGGQADPVLCLRVANLIRTREKILLGIVGTKASTLLITPPLCFTVENARRLVKALDSVLTSVVKENSSTSNTSSSLSLECEGPDEGPPAKKPKKPLI